MTVRELITEAAGETAEEARGAAQEKLLEDLHPLLPMEIPPQRRRHWRVFLRLVGMAAADAWFHELAARSPVPGRKVIQSAHPIAAPESLGQAGIVRPAACRRRSVPAGSAGAPEAGTVES